MHRVVKAQKANDDHLEEAEVDDDKDPGIHFTVDLSSEEAKCAGGWEYYASRLAHLRLVASQGGGLVCGKPMLPPETSDESKRYLVGRFVSKEGSAIRIKFLRHNLHDTALRRDDDDDQWWETRLHYRILETIPKLCTTISISGRDLNEAINYIYEALGKDIWPESLMDYGNKFAKSVLTLKIMFAEGAKFRLLGKDICDCYDDSAYYVSDCMEKIISDWGYLSSVWELVDVDLLVKLELGFVNGNGKVEMIKTHTQVDKLLGLLENPWKTGVTIEGGNGKVEMIKTHTQVDKLLGLLENPWKTGVTIEGLTFDHGLSHFVKENQKK